MQSPSTPSLPPDLEAVARRVLSAIARVPFASVESLMAHARGVGLTPEILDRWCDAKVLHRARVTTDALSGAETAYVALAPAGARLLGKLVGRAVRAVSAARLRRSTQRRLHDIAVGDLGLAVLALAERGLIDLIGIETDDRKLATTTTLVLPDQAPRRVPLQADALVLVRGERGPTGLLVEVDRGTISPAKMRDRYAAYLAWKREGGPERDFSVKALRVVTIAPDKRRHAKLHTAALGASGGKRSGFLAFALQADVTPARAERLLDPIAQVLSPENEPLITLLPLRGTPKPPGAGADRRDSGGAPRITHGDLGTPASPRLPAAAGPPVPPVL